ncbi:MAG: hypothetical protein IJA85_00965 [Clostridia bacterium]|nr:hypothetical protein [Clostridia bacterium]
MFGTPKEIDSLIREEVEKLSSPAGGLTMIYNGKMLFTVNSPHHIMLQHRNMEDEYGLLPFPKYDEKQDRYYSYVSQWYPTLGVPGTIENPNRAVNILNAMGYNSSELTDVYVNTIISEKASRDEGSKQSALLALESKFYDIDRMMSITGIFTIFNKMTQNGKDVFASEYARIEEQAQLKLDELFGGE